MENVIVYCETKATKDGLAVKTKLTLDVSGLVDKDILDYATDAMVIKWQGNTRRNAVKNGVKIPTETTYIVPKPGTRGATGISREQALRKVIGDMGGNYDEILAKAGSFDALWNKFSLLMGEYGTVQNAVDELGEEE